MAEAQTKPPMRPSNEATEKTLELAREQGAANKKALRYMVDEEAHDGAEVPAGEYLVAYAIEKAEGLYHLRDGTLHWQEPTDENLHLEVSVRDGADGRFIPGLQVFATLLDAQGTEVGTHEQPFLWHPWLFHYGRNWKVPGDGTYTLRVRIEPPTFARHDKVNGKRFAQAVEVEFKGLNVKTGQKKS